MIHWRLCQELFTGLLSIAAAVCGLVLVVLALEADRAAMWAGVVIPVLFMATAVLLGMAYNSVKFRANPLNERKES